MTTQDRLRALADVMLSSPVSIVPAYGQALADLLTDEAQEPQPSPSYYEMAVRMQAAEAGNREWNDKFELWRAECNKRVEQAESTASDALDEIRRLVGARVQAEAERDRLIDAECLTCGAKPSDHAPIHEGSH